MRKINYLLLLPIVLLSACVTEPTAADPVNSANYVINTLDSRTSASLDQTLAAFDRVMARGDFTRTSLESDEVGRVAVYRGPEDVGVTVKLKGFSQFTNIKIRYEIIGNEFESRKILEAVINELN